MISFRFHVVSITAVFLAIAIGVVVGTTYVDGAVVDGLRNRIDSVEQNLDDRKAENDRMEAELGLAGSYIDTSAAFAVTDRLTDVPVLLLAARGVDEAAVERTAGLARTVGAVTPGVVWLEPSWNLENDDDRAALAEIIGGDAEDAPEDLAAAAWTAVAAELSLPGEEATPNATPPPSVLEPLVDAGFLSVDALDDDSTALADLAGTQPRVLVVTGTRAEAGPAAVAPTIADATVGAELLTVLGDVHVIAPEAPGRGEELIASLSPEVLEVAAIVDNADRTEGQVGSVLALSAAADGPVGHLGYGDGAVGVLPTVDADVTPAPAGATSVTRSVAGMGAAAAVSRTFGGLRMVVIAAVLGTTYLGNTFQAANSVSNVLFELLAAGALSAVLVPTFVGHFSRSEDRRVEEVAGGVLSIAYVVLGVVSLLGILFAPQLAHLLTAGVADPEVVEQQEELTTYLLRFFIPQVLLYALGAVATAVLHARGRFALPAIAPIGNTVVIVVAMLVFRAMAGPDPGLDLSSGEQLCLALGGTLGVAAFVGIPAIGLRTSGFRFRMRRRRPWADPDVRSLLHLSGWAALQHSGMGILLAASLVVCGSVAGGVVAYQLAMVVFLAPYGIVAQPIHTAVLPRLADDAASGDSAGLHRSLRWAVEAMAVWTLPLAAALTALSAPVMSVLAFGQAADGDGPQLLGAALLGLAVGIPAYGGFLLMTRAAYALGDSRTPALASLGSAILGAAGMVVAGQVADGSTRLALVGGAHSLAYAAGGVWLVLRLHPRVGMVLGMRLLRPLGLAIVLGLAAWAAMEAWSPDGRLAVLVALAVIGAAGAALYVAGLRALGAMPGPGPTVHRRVGV